MKMVHCRGLAMLVWAGLALTTWGDATQEEQIRALSERMRVLEERVQQLEQRAAPASGETEARARAARLRKQFEARMEQDRATYSQEERQEIERLYQSANRQLDAPEARESLRKLTDRYAKANRTGCALLYLGQMATGAEKEQYLRRAFEDFGHCWYGDGVQVGAYARYHLAMHYQQTGRTTEAAALFATIRKDFPDAVDHKGNLLSDLMPR